MFEIGSKFEFEICLCIVALANGTLELCMSQGCDSCKIDSKTLKNRRRRKFRESGPLILGLLILGPLPFDRKSGRVHGCPSGNRVKTQWIARKSQMNERVFGPRTF